MDINAIRDFVNANPDGFEVTMIDGTRFRVPHRDYLWFTPAATGPTGAAPRRFSTAFYLNADGHTRLVNALLVKEIHAIPRSGDGRKRRARRAA